MRAYNENVTKKTSATPSLVIGFTKFTFPMLIQNRISTSTGKDRVSDKELILFINTEARLVVGSFAIWL